MMKTIKTASIAAAVTMLLASNTSAAALIPPSVPLPSRGYEWISKQRGVDVFKHRSKKIIKLGAEGRIAAPPASLLSVLLDYEGQRGRIERLTESRVLARGAGWLLVYQRLNLPVISDRDFVLRVTWGVKGRDPWIRYSAVDDVGPKPRAGVVRVTRHEGGWQLRRTADGGTQVRFQTAIDLGGWLPMWLARSGAGKELPALFSSVRAMARSKAAQLKAAQLRPRPQTAARKTQPNTTEQRSSP